MMHKQLQQHISKAQKALGEVEQRSWHGILLSSINPIDESGEALKLLKIASGFQQFTREFAETNYDAKQEAYAVLRAAYDNRSFPQRRYLSKLQFARLLVLHLERF